MASLQHILAPEPGESPDRLPPSAEDPMSAHSKHMQPYYESADEDEDAATTPRPNAAKSNDEAGDVLNNAFATASSKRNANGNISSVYSGNKMKHLKKGDGVPLWRKDIQYEFLKLVFYDQTKCFTKYSDGTAGHTFAEIYIDSMAKSSKTSKILKDKLLQDQDGAISMAMVCLLVNLGRMNTTLNFFPEMRAQLRTYHSIPALQAHQDPSAYKQLQDAPRLKSILKGATEDDPQPATMDAVKDSSIPRTNPVNLIFIMSQYAPKVSELHFQPPRDFFDLIMRPTLSSASRARAFLWLLWWYLESNFTEQDSQNNPFGPGRYGEGQEGTDALPVVVPTLESLTEEQAEEENVDTESEKHFGEVKRKERIAILASEPSAAMTALKRARKEKGLGTGHLGHASDDEGSETGYQRPFPASVGKLSGLHHETGSEYTRSPSPATSRGFQAVNTKPAGDMRINNLLNSDDAVPDTSPPDDAPSVPAPKVRQGPGRGNWRRKKPQDPAATGGLRLSQEGTHNVPLLPNTGQISFVNDGPPGMQMLPTETAGASPNVSFHNATITTSHVPTPSYQAQKRNRGITQHQSAVITHRKMQIDYHLDRRLRETHVRARDEREAEGPIIRAWKRIRHMPVDYDSEEEGMKIRKTRDRGDKHDDDGRAANRGKENEDFLQVDQWRRPRVLYAGLFRVNGEECDVGEEAKSLAQSFRRVSRRIERWEETDLPGSLIEMQEGMREGKRPHGTKPRRRREAPVDRTKVPRDPPLSRSRRNSDHLRQGYAPRGMQTPDPDDPDRTNLNEEEREILAELDNLDNQDEEDDSDEEMGDDGAQ